MSKRTEKNSKEAWRLKKKARAEQEPASNLLAKKAELEAKRDKLDLDIAEAEERAKGVSQAMWPHSALVQEDKQEVKAKIKESLAELDTESQQAVLNDLKRQYSGKVLTGHSSQASHIADLRRERADAVIRLNSLKEQEKALNTQEKAMKGVLSNVSAAEHADWDSLVETMARIRNLKGDRKKAIAAEKRITAELKAKFKNLPPEEQRRVLEEASPGVLQELQRCGAFSPPPPDRRPPYAGVQRATPEEQSVDAYLELMSFCLQIARGPASQLGDPKAVATRDDRRAIAMQDYLAFREARVFHIGGDVYKAVHEEADRYTTESAGLNYQPAALSYQRARLHTIARNISNKDTASNDKGFEVSDDENKQYTRWFMSEAKNQVYPDKLPFPNIFLGYGSGVLIPAHIVELKAPKALRDRLTKVVLIGHLMTDTGRALACYRGFGRSDDLAGYGGYGKVDDGKEVSWQWVDEARSPEYGWTRGLDVEPWTLPHLVRIINDHRTFVIETELSGSLKKDIKKNRKTLGLNDFRHMPKPYYTLRLQAHVVQEKVRKQLGRPKKPISYKTDVRGHERCRIRRGRLPIDGELASKLHKLGYKLFTVNQLDEDTYRRLSERGLAYKRADEWLAVKTIWVSDYLSCLDPALPYIPAVRVLGKIRIRAPKKTGAWTEDSAAR